MNKTLLETYKEITSENRDTWKTPWLKDVCELCLEYLTLEGLQDAQRAARIPDEILDICEKALNE